MIGIQENVTYRNRDTKEKDLFCANCFDIVKMNYLLKEDVEFECPKCGTINSYSKKQQARVMGRKYEKRHPIRYWAKKYGIPENSCYMAFRKRGMTIKKKAIGASYLMTQREFLSAALYTNKGRKVVQELISKEKLLTLDMVKK